MNVFKEKINVSQLLDIQRGQYQEKLLLEGTIGADTSLLTRVNISSLGSFICLFMTGSFTTLTEDGGNIVDNGVVSLSAKMSDGSNQRSLFNDHVPLDLFLSPGRSKSALSTTVLTTDDQSNSLFYPQPFQYIFRRTSEILFDVKNTANTPNSFQIAFNGIRVLGQ